ncbi:MAG: hypothetical protein AAF383_19270 [Cyanobacteria bacterium P01_A01_bin.83]
MNQRLSSIFLAISISAINVLPSNAAAQNQLKIEPSIKQLMPQIILSSGQWCFKFKELGLFCYVL